MFPNSLCPLLDTDGFRKVFHWLEVHRVAVALLPHLPVPIARWPDAKAGGTGTFSYLEHSLQKGEETAIELRTLMKRQP